MTPETQIPQNLSGPALILVIIVLVVFFASWWRLFEKVGLAGWKALIPFYNTWLLAQIAGRPGWMGLAMSLAAGVPVWGMWVALIFQVMIYVDLAKAFGKTTGFAVGLVLLAIVFFPILAFGDSEYQYWEYEQTDEDSQP